MTKFASTLGILAVFAACSTTDSTDDTATGGASPNGGASAKGGAGGRATAGEGGGDDNTNQGGKTQGSGGAVSHTGGATGEAGGGVDGGVGGVPAAEGGMGGIGVAGSGGSDIGAGGSTTPVVSTDTCAAAETTPNDDRTSATAYKLGSAYTACLQNDTDVDVYAFQVPSDSRGGYVTVSVTDVGASGDISMSAYASSDNGKFYQSGSNTEGASVYMYFTVKPGAKFYVPVSKYLDVKAPTAYTFSAVYHQLPDIYEPNDVRAQAKVIAVGTPIEAYMLGGRESSTNIPTDDWADWYQVDLAAGDVNILLSITASDIDGRIVLYDAVGTQVATEGSNTDGSSVVLKQTIATPGTYYVKVSPYIPPGNTEGNTTAVPQYLRYPYSLTVSQ